jgi:mRNA interferase MazF
MNGIQRGDIVYTPFPFSDLTGQKFRPALVLGVDGDLVIVCFISSKQPSENLSLVRVMPNEENGLLKPSTIVVSKLISLDKKVLIGRLGTLDRVLFEEVNRRLLEVFELSNRG